ncbi:MAG: hypothetical protein ACO1Q7_07400 [Gemmatimonas sp.]
MHVDHLPYSLRELAFPFPALAALAGRLPLGGGREIALAALTAARLASSMIGPEPLPADERTTRAAAARTWVASLALTSAMRAHFTRCYESTASTPAAAASTVRSLLSVINANLDGPASQELDRLARRLTIAE